MRPSICVSSILAAAVLAACAGGRALTREALVGTRWTERCPDAEIATAYLRLEPDSSLAWSYVHRDSLESSDVHGWRVEDGELVVSWNLGGAETRYRRGGGATLAGASSFCSETVTLVPTP